MRKAGRILIIENSLAVTGAFKSVLEVSKILSEEFEFHYCVPSRSALGKQLTAAGFPVFRLPFVEISRSVRSLLFYLPMLLINTFRLRNYVRDHNVEVVHVNDLFNLTGVLLRRLVPSVKVIYHVRLMPGSYLGLLYPWLMRRVAGGANEVVFVSEAVRRACPVKPERSHVIYDGILAVENYPAKATQHGPCKILYLANYTPGKGQLLALESYALALPSIPGATLTFVGGDLGSVRNAEYRQLLEKKIQEMGLAASVSVRGFADEVESLIKSHDILLNCSESESFSMTCLEAMMYGTAVIATDSGGPAEIISKDTGILVANRDVSQISEALVLLCNDNALRASLAAQARVEVRRKFSLEKSAAQLSLLYKSRTG